jgi:hypothetical protein
MIQTSKLVELENSLSCLQLREKQLVAELKKKGDLARQIIADKDAEVNSLKMKLADGIKTVVEKSVETEVHGVERPLSQSNPTSEPFLQQVIFIIS